MKKIAILLSVLSIILSTRQVFSQCMYYPVPFEERVANSKYIVQGKVTGKHSYLDQPSGNIYTLNTFSVNAWLKNYRSDAEVYVITLGGVLGNKATEFIPSLQLSQTLEYILLLEEDNNQLDDKALRQQKPRTLQCMAYTDAQGALIKKGNIYFDLLVESPKTEGIIFQRISSLTNERAKKPAGTLFHPVEEIVANPNKIHTITITGVSPNPTNAGTINSGDFITITGAGFGATQGTKIVEFPNADYAVGTATISPPNASDYVFWNDGTITVKVPELAGSGFFKVDGVTSPMQLTINYSHRCVDHNILGFSAPTRQGIHLRNLDGLGGYSFTFHTGFFTNTPAVDAFRRAMNEWNCNTDINWRTRGCATTTTANNNEDGVNIISFAASLANSALGLTTIQYYGRGNASCNLDNTVWWAGEIDMQFLQTPGGANTWQFGPGFPSATQYDFETAALHELGHAHGLGHVINPSDIMHFEGNPGSAIRTLSSNNINAGRAKLAYSSSLPCWNPPAFPPAPPNDPGNPNSGKPMEFLICGTARSSSTQTAVCYADRAACSGSSISSTTFTGGVNSTIFMWTMSQDIGIGVGPTVGNIPSFTGTNNTSLPKSALVTVTATTNGVTGTFASFNITVNPTPNVTVQGGYNYCNSITPTNGPSFSSTVSGTVFTWTCTWTPSSYVGFGTSGTTVSNIPIAAFIPVNNGSNNSPVGGSLKVHASANGCTGTPPQGISTGVTIWATPIVNAVPNATYNHGDAGAVINFSSDVPSFYARFDWSGSAYVGFPISGTTANGSPYIDHFTATNITTAPLVSTVQVFGLDPLHTGINQYNFIGCRSTDAQSKTFTVTVNPLACAGSATWTGAVNNSYSTAGNWSTNCVPTAAMDVVIPLGTPTVTGGSVSVKNITLQSGATLNLNNGGILSLSGDFVNQGTIVSSGSSATGKIVFGGTALQNISGTGVFSHVEVANTIGVVLLTNVTVKSMKVSPGAKLTVPTTKTLITLQ